MKTVISTTHFPVYLRSAATGFVLLALLLGSLPSHGAVIEDFEGDVDWRIHDAETRGGRLVFSEAPKPRGTSACVQWKAERASFLALHAIGRPALPGFGEGLKGTVSLDVYSAGTDDVHAVSMRLVDAQNEVFQWGAHPDLSQAGWRTLTYPVSADNFDGNWGTRGEENGVPDLPMRFFGLTVGLVDAGQPATGRIWIDNVRYNGPSATVRVPENVDESGELPVLDAVEVDVSTGHPLHVVEPGRQTPVVVTLNNRALEPAAFRLLLNIEEFDGRSLRLEQTFDVEPEGKDQWTLPLDLKREGIRWVDYTLLERDGDGRRSDRATFAVLRPSGPRPARSEGFMFGMTAHAHRDYYSDRDRELAALAAGMAGANIMRCGIPWGGIQPSENEWRWEMLDQLVETYAEQNVEVLCLVGFTPAWAATVPTPENEWLIWSRKPPELDAWRRYIRRAAERYKDKIRFWEIWNEPNHGFFKGTPAEYVELLKIAYEEIKAVNPDACVMNGGYGHRNRDFMQYVVPHAREYTDFVTYHLHSDFERFSRRVDNEAVVLRDKYMPGTPLYFTETAMSARGGSKRAERNQAMELVKKLTFTRSRNTRGYHWYKMRAHPPEHPKSHHSYGLFSYGWDPKPVYAAYNALTGVLSGASFAHELDLGANQYGYVFQQGNKRIVVAWAGSAEAIQQVLLSLGAERAETVDIMGNRTTASMLPGGQTVLTLGETPSYLVLHGVEKKIAVSRPLVSLESPQVVVPGRDNEISVQVFNPYKGARDVECTLSLPPGLGGEQLASRTTMAPRRQQAVRFGLETSGATSRADPGQTWAADFHYRIGKLSGSMPLPLFRAKRIPAKPATGQREPDFALNDSQDVVNLFDAVPSKSHLQWKGPEDLSADIWLGSTENALQLRVVVQDDAHVQPFDAKHSWKGDNVQAALAIPGQDGYWEINLARMDDGASKVFANRYPDGFAGVDRTVDLSTERRANITVYEASFPFESFQITPRILRNGMRFSMIVNDNDGDIREGWIRVSRGLATSKNASFFPFIVLTAERRNQ